MPTLSVDRDSLFQVLGKTYTEKEFDEPVALGVEADPPVGYDIEANPWVYEEDDIGVELRAQGERIEAELKEFTQRGRELHSRWYVWEQACIDARKAKLAAKNACVSAGSKRAIDGDNGTVSVRRVKHGRNLSASEKRARLHILSQRAG